MTAIKAKEQRVIGIDLGGTNLLASVVGSDGSIIARTHLETQGEMGYEHVLGRIQSAIKEVLDQSQLGVTDLAGIGIAVAGAVDVETGIVLRAENLDWDNKPLMVDLQERLKSPVVLDNDVNAAIWGEFLFGAGKNRGDCFGVWVGTGIGGGLVLNGQLYHGTLSTAGEFGMSISSPDDDKTFRTVEDHASRTGMQNHYARLMQDYPDSELCTVSNGNPKQIGNREFANAYEMNDVLACRIIEHGADRIGTAIANFVTMLSVDTVILGGGVIETLGDRYLQRICERFDRDVFPPHCRECKLVRTTLEADAGLLGAAMLARTKLHQ